MNETNENGLTMVSLVIIIILLLITSVLTITTITDQEILPRTINAENEYNAMVKNQQNEMEGNRVLEILDF